MDATPANEELRAKYADMMIATLMEISPEEQAGIDAYFANLEKEKQGSPESQKEQS